MPAHQPLCDVGDVPDSANDDIVDASRILFRLELTPNPKYVKMAQYFVHFFV